LRHINIINNDNNNNNSKSYSCKKVQGNSHEEKLRAILQILHHYLQVNHPPITVTIVFIFLELNTANPFNKRSKTKPIP